MATRKYTLGLGKSREQVVEATGSVIAGAPAIEVNIDFDAKMTQSDVIKALDQVGQHIISTKWPPA